MHKRTIWKEIGTRKPLILAWMKITVASSTLNASTVSGLVATTASDTFASTGADSCGFSSADRIAETFSGTSESAAVLKLTSADSGISLVAGAEVSDIALLLSTLWRADLFRKLQPFLSPFIWNAITKHHQRETNYCKLGNTRDMFPREKVKTDWTMILAFDGPQPTYLLNLAFVNLSEYVLTSKF